MFIKDGDCHSQFANWLRNDAEEIKMAQAEACAIKDPISPIIDQRYQEQDFL